MLQIKRVEKLREKALEKEISGFRSEEGRLLWYKGWIQNKYIGSHLLRRAAAKAYMLQNSTPVIDEDELIVGKPFYGNLTEENQKELLIYDREYDDVVLRIDGQASHMAIDYEKILNLGFDGMKKEISEKRNVLILENPEDMEKDEFYQACLISLDGVMDYAENYSKEAFSLAQSCQDEKRKRELFKIGEILKKVPRFPAETFYEALQAVHFVTFCLEGLYQLGRPDRYLDRYYSNDIKNGNLTKEEAFELICCIGILYNEYIPKGLAVGWMVGGRDEQGRDVTNDLSYLSIESIRHTRMVYPAIGLCYDKDTPAAILNLSCEVLSEGHSHPAIFNDDLIRNGLKSYGLTDKEACSYIHSTCVEITPVATSAVWVASPYTNLVQLLLDILGLNKTDGKPGNTDPARFKSFDDIVREYKAYLGEVIRKNSANQNRLQLERSRHGGDPLVSCFVDDCIERGKDIDCGGARYNWIMPSFVGLSNLADSFLSIKKLVYGEGEVTLTDLVKALNDNFEGHELLYNQILSIPKYGNDLEEADSMISEITGWILEETKKLKTYRGDKVIPSLFCWIMHEHFGTNTAASPDGRKKGFPLGDGSGPAQGREANGPTASILSSTKWNHEPFIGGIAVNLKFARTLLGKSSIANMSALVKTYIERGGFELQINVVDRETLLKARKDPQAYRDLVVRVGGYSDYFIHLSPAMQEEVILRTGHDI